MVGWQDMQSGSTSIVALHQILANMNAKKKKKHGKRLEVVVVV
jgi:hypothetical protein